MRRTQSGLFKNRAVRSLFRELRKFLVELIDTTCSVNEFHFAGEERMAVGRYFHFHKRVFLSVFPGGGLFRVHTGFAEERIVRRDVFEYHEAIVSRMDIFFHDCILLKICCKPELSKFEAQR